MALIKVIITAALLALSGVEASSSKVAVSQWVNQNCSGHLSHNQKHIKLGKCEKVSAQSISLHVPKHKKNLNPWLRKVNSGDEHCYVITYANGGCKDDDRSARTFSVPSAFEKCISGANAANAGAGFRSVKFHCEPRGKFHETVVTAPFEYTSYAIGSGNRVATPSVGTTTSSGTEYTWLPGTYPPGPKTSLAPRSNAHIEPRVAVQDKHTFKDAWYKHPWGGNSLCYECWLTKNKNKDKFECESSEHHGLNCTQPDPNLQVQFFTTTTTRPPVTVTSTVYAATGPAAGKAIEERREHKIVRINHPFLGVSTCAKAKWVHPGKHNQKVILKGPHRCKGNDFSVDITKPSATATFTAPGRTYTSYVVLPSPSPTPTTITSIQTQTVTLPIIVSTESSTTPAPTATQPVAPPDGVEVVTVTVQVTEVRETVTVFA